MVEPTEAIREIEEAYYVAGMTLSALVTASNQAREKVTLLFRSMTKREMAIVHLQPPLDRMGRLYSVTAIKHFDPDDRHTNIQDKDIYGATIDLYSAVPDDMATLIYQALLSIAKKMTDDDVINAP